jgi:hypothetical protein
MDYSAPFMVGDFFLDFFDFKRKKFFCRLIGGAVLTAAAVAMAVCQAL